MGEEWALPDLSSGSDEDLRHYRNFGQLPSQANETQQRQQLRSNLYVDAPSSSVAAAGRPSYDGEGFRPARTMELYNGRPPPLPPPLLFRPDADDDLPSTNNVYSAVGDAEDAGFSGAGEGLFDGGDEDVGRGGCGDGDGDGAVFGDQEHEESRLNTSSGSGVMTTVPPCMLRNTIATETGTMRHLPTRSSLRHSRMLVNSSKVHPSHTTKGGFAGLMTRGAVIRDYRVGAALACVQLFLGLLQVGLACWILLLWSPSPASLHHREVPHWSGVITTAAGSIGLVLMCCCPRKSLFRYKASYVTKILSVIFTTGSVIACLCAAGFAAIHLVFLADTSCVEISSPSLPAASSSDNVVPGSVADVAESYRDEDDDDGGGDVSRPHSSPSSRIPGLSERHVSAILASLTDEPVPVGVVVGCDCRRRGDDNDGGSGGARRLSYAGVRCIQVRTVLRSLLIAVCVVGSAAALASTGYLCLLWTSRYYYIPAGTYFSLAAAASSRLRTSSSVSAAAIRNTAL